MGLLGKAIARNNMELAATVASTATAASTAPAASAAVPTELESAIVNFHRKIPVFHGIVLQGQVSGGMIASHGAVCVDLPGGNTFVLLPGALDRELFAHRLSHSTGSAVLAQFCVNSPSLALETLSPYLR
jgi:hypothetical protein